MKPQKPSWQRKQSDWTESLRSPDTIRNSYLNEIREGGIRSLLPTASHSDAETELEEAREVIEQLSRIVSEFSVKYPMHSGRIPIPQGNEHPLIAFVRGMVSSMSRNEEKHRELHEQALAAAKAKELFLANLSHEVRTPLNGICGMVNLLFDTELSPTQNDYLATINSSSETLLNVVNDVLDISKAKSSSLKLRPREFDFQDLLREINRTYYPLAKHKGIKLQVEYESTLPRYYKGDDLRLRQVFSNLLSNALKFTEEGTITLTVDECHQRGKYIDLNVFVEDTGVGIPQKSIKDLFDPFTQADNSTTRTHEGTGLGLSICSSIIGLMQGKIGVRSTVGKGSTFYFRCRLEVSSGAELTSDETPSELDTLPLAGADSTNRILLAEDNPVNQKVARLMLERLGFEVTIAGNGQEAVTMAIQGSEFDFICMDVCMPVMDGLEATRRIRKSRSPNQNTPIIAMTGMAMEDDLRKCLDAGMDHFLSKPIDIAKLKMMLRKQANTEAQPEGIVLAS